MKVPLRQARASLLSLVSSARWTLGFAYANNRALMLALAAAVIVRGVLPGALALTTRALVDSLFPAGADTFGTWLSPYAWLSIVVGITMLDGVSAAGQAYLRQRLSDDLNLQMSSLLAQSFAKLEARYLELQKWQDLHSRVLTRSIVSAANTPSNIFLFATNIAQLLSIVAVLVWLEPLIAVLAPLLTVGFVGYRVWLARRSFGVEHTRTTQRRWQRYYLAMLTEYRHAFEVKLLRLSDEMVGRFKRLLTLFRDQDRTLQRFALGGDLLLQCVAALVTFVLLARIVARVVAGASTVGNVVAYIAALGRFTTTLQGLTGVTGTLREQLLYSQDVRAVFAIEPDVPTHALNEPLPHRAPIIFDHVSFRYPGATTDVLHDVTVRIEPGELIAIVGENGAGKSTLVKLIAGLYHPTEGRILYGTHDIATIEPERWFALVSFVFQQFNRYEASVEENIAYGDWTRWREPDRDMSQFARAAGIHDDILAMPQAYATLLGRTFGDYAPSDGQWQRIALARALAHESSAIVILDEPTAHADAHAEHALFETYIERRAGRTAILISHRFSNVRAADRIIVLEDGCVIEQGTHDALVALNGAYAAMYQLQAARYQDVRT